MNTAAFCWLERKGRLKKKKKEQRVYVRKHKQSLHWILVSHEANGYIMKQVVKRKLQRIAITDIQLHVLAGLSFFFLPQQYSPIHSKYHINTKLNTVDNLFLTQLPNL